MSDNFNFICADCGPSEGDPAFTDNNYRSYCAECNPKLRIKRDECVMRSLRKTASFESEHEANSGQREATERRKPMSGPYVKCPKGCGKKFISLAHAEKHVEVDHAEPAKLLRKGWVTPHGFVDFAEPITYEQACETMETIYNLMKNKIEAKG